MLTLVVANLPNLIPANISGYTVHPVLQLIHEATCVSTCVCIQSCVIQLVVLCHSKSIMCECGLTCAG